MQQCTRDEDLIQNLITIEMDFWKQHIESHILPEPDGSDAYSDMLSKLYPNAKKEKEILLVGLDEDLQRRKEVDTLIDKLEKEKETIDQKIKLQMEDASYGKFGEYRIYWTEVQSKRMDTKRLKAEQPYIYLQELL